MKFLERCFPVRHGAGGSSWQQRALALGATAFALAATIATPAVADTSLATPDLAVSPLVSPEPPTVTGIAPADGPAKGGTKVEIIGTNLGGATAVDFGMTAASKFTVRSATAIGAVAPAGAGTVDVTVTTPEGTSAASAADQFAYTDSPPVVREVLPDEGPAAGGTSVTILGLYFLPATAVDFGGTSAVSFTVESNKSITAVAPPGTAGKALVTVTSPYGTSGPESCILRNPPGGCHPRDHFKFGVPTITDVTPATGSTTGGTSVTITGTGFGIGATATTVKFGGTRSPTVECTSTTTCTVVAPPRKAGTVDIRATVNRKTSKPSPADQFTSM